MQKKLRKVSSKRFLKTQKEPASFKAQKQEKQGTQYKIVLKKKDQP